MKGGSSVMVASKMMPTMKMKTRPTLKLRSLNRAGLYVGVGVGEDMHHEEIEGHHHQRAVSMTISRLANQFWELSPVQRHLQRPDAQAQQGKTQQIEAAAGIDASSPR
jgi:hypothetical protein